MARLSGGDILLHVNVSPSNATASDFDKKIFKKICEESISSKTLKILFKDLFESLYVFNFSSVDIGGCAFRFSNINVDESDGHVTMAETILIEYNNSTDTLDYTYNYFEE